MSPPSSFAKEDPYECFFYHISKLSLRPYQSSQSVFTNTNIIANLHLPQSSWIDTFDADVAHIPDRTLIDAYSRLNYSTDALRSGAQYGDARFNCPVDYLLNERSSQQDTWVYRFFGAYDNVVGPPGTAPTHGSEVPFFHGGNECFEALAGVTEEQQALADSIHSWLVDFVKDPAAGPGWDKVSEEGRLVKLGVPGDELERIPAKREEYNSICRDVYNPAFPEYPVVQSVAGIIASL